MSDEIKGPGFVFRDKRGSQESEEEPKRDSPGDQRQPGDMPPDEPRIDFSTLLLSLASSAFYHLGDIADPNSGEKKVDLAAVRQTIDILVMLKEKTRGNLSEEEKKLIEQLIYELQMKYVAHGKK
jgi:hypothetical protein